MKLHNTQSHYVNHHFTEPWPQSAGLEPGP